ncbi:prepilin peptidase [Actinomadura livida]|uniref:Leader peptidase (Prepilin peptidase)/N-methyltransferase n=1 Tax=Actinomadura livida TaxID=79909 RepID=A0A7W7MWY0_9ACTN|nr:MULTISPECIES: A24 family peptidase [Actinomadura]MBB4773317.1 leader peptidase (prepilin peptidase)/N-methyltransferase [Actinomadura catellatispora]
MLVPVGLVVGLLAAPLAVPFTGEVPRRRRILMGLVTAAVFGILGWRVGPEPILPALLYLAAAGTLLAFIDVAVKRLPDRFTLPSYGIGAALLAVAAPFTEEGMQRFQHALIGMVVLFVLYFVQAFLAPSGIGMGDVKLSGVLGLYLGWFGQDAWMAGVLATYFIGGLVGVGLMIVRRTRKGEFPFGPYMFVGTLIAVLAFAG